MGVSTLNPTPNERWFRRTGEKEKISPLPPPPPLTKNGSTAKTPMIPSAT